MQRLGSDILHAIPKLIALALIVALTVTILRFVSRIFALLATGGISLRNFEPEWAVPTARLVRLGVVVLAMIMAYPAYSRLFVGCLQGDVDLRGHRLLAGVGVVCQEPDRRCNSMIYRHAFHAVGDRVENRPGVTRDRQALSPLQDTHIRTLMNGPGDAAERAGAREPRTDFTPDWRRTTG